LIIVEQYMPNFSAIDILTLNILEVFLYVLELNKKEIRNISTS